MELSVKIEPGDRIVGTDPAFPVYGRHLTVSRVIPEGVFATVEGSTATLFLRHDSYQLLKANATTITTLVRIKPTISEQKSRRWQAEERSLWPVEAHDSEGVWIREPVTDILHLFLWSEIEIDSNTPLQPPSSSPPPKIDSAVLTEECMIELVERTALRVVQLLREGPPWTATSISSSTEAGKTTGKTSTP